MNAKIFFTCLLAISSLCRLVGGDISWTKHSPTSGQPVWSGVGISNDGGTLAASAWNNFLYISADAGSTWKKATPAGNTPKGWNSLSMSTDGKSIAVCAWNDFVYLSNDGGIKWSKLSPAGKDTKGWKAIFLSSDGTTIIACAYNDYLYRSTDSGKTWSKLQPAGKNVVKGWNSVSSSKTGEVIIVSAYNDYVYVSKDSGKTWAKKDPSGKKVAKGWISVNCSEDGKTLMTVAYNDFPYLSKDGGSTWSKKSPDANPKGWMASSMSADGAKFAVCAANDYVYTSKDGGSKWEKNNPSNAKTGSNWSTVLMSATGTRVIAGVQGANVYSGVSATIPWELVFDAGQGGSLLENARQTVLNGDDALPVTALADTGYNFTGWTGDITNSTNPIIIKKVKKNMKITADFALKSYEVKFETDGTAGAEISGETEQTIEHGKDCSEVSVSVPNGFYFAGWVLNNHIVSSANPFVAKNIVEPRTYVAKFEQAPAGSFVVAFVADSSKGAIQGPSVQIIPAGGSSAEILAVGNASNHFVKWTRNGEDFSTDNPLVVNDVNENMTIEAAFDINSYLVKFETDGTEGATIEGEVEQTIVHGSGCTQVNAVAPANAYFTKWTQGGKDISIANPYAPKNITANKTFIANFAVAPQNKFTVVFFVEASKGDIDGEKVQFVSDGESTDEVTVIPAEGYSFSAWLKGGKEFSTENPLIVKDVKENMTIEAKISKNIYTLKYAAEDGGSIKGATLQRVRHGDSGTEVSAVPNDGYEFVQWSDEVKNNPRKDTNVKSDISVTAIFAQKQGWTTFDILKTTARSNRLSYPNGIKDSYSFSIKARVPSDFSWSEMLGKSMKISFGEAFEFVGELCPDSVKCNVYCPQKGGKALFSEKDISPDGKKKKARRICIRWNKNNELWITMRKAPVAGETGNIVEADDFEITPEGEFTGRGFSKVSVAIGDSASGKYQVEFTGTITAPDKDQDSPSKEDCLWRLRASPF